MPTAAIRMATFANSEGWNLNEPIMTQRVAPFVSVPKNSTTSKRTTVTALMSGRAVRHQ